MKHPSLFAQDWWLEATNFGVWKVANIEKNGSVIARMPYIIRKHRGLTMIVMPPLTPHLGPWIAPLSGKYATRLSREHRLFEQLIHKLPRFDFFLQNFHYSITNWLPFYWQGFQQTTRYTYVIEDLSDLDRVWMQFLPKLRANIRKARKLVSVRTDLGLETFWHLNRKTFSRQGMDVPYTLDYLIRIDTACAERQQRRIFFAEDAKGHIHAALYLVWDDQAAYYLIGGNDPELQTSGAPSLLIWEAIRFAATVTRTFDFEGSMIPGVERFFRSFGAKQKPYFRVSKATSLAFQVRQDIRRWWCMLRD
ncbi:MAG: GNAT family N-acetyltransferase [Chloroflexi bacterium]|nr:GNAT family N-acetyltransferase [Chloroflexota bacterium]